MMLTNKSTRYRPTSPLVFLGGTQTSPEQGPSSAYPPTDYPSPHEPPLPPSSWWTPKRNNKVDRTLNNGAVTQFATAVMAIVMLLPTVMVMGILSHLTMEMLLKKKIMSPRGLVWLADSDFCVVLMRTISITIKNVGSSDEHFTDVEFLTHIIQDSLLLVVSILLSSWPSLIASYAQKWQAQATLTPFHVSNLKAIASFGTGGGIRTALCTPPERSFTVGFHTTVYAWLCVCQLSLDTC